MKKYLKVGKLIDVSNKEVLSNKGIIIDNDTIINIEDIRDELKGFEVYDYIDKTVMPGMINCHVHLGMEPVADTKKYYDETNYEEYVINTLRQLKEYLNSGVTYVRSLGTINYLDVKLKKMINEGKIEGPGIVASGPVVCMTGGHGHFFGVESDGEDECRKHARQILKNGVDCIKLMSTGGVLTEGVEPGSPQLTYEELKSAIDEAKRAGKTTATHAHGHTGIKNAVLAGIDSIEHGTYMDDEIIDLMIEKGTYLVPTLAAPYFILEAGLESGIPKEGMRKCEQIAIPHKEAVVKAYKKGVKIAMGSDAGTCFNRHDKSYYELKLLVESGFENMDAIISSTKIASELLKIDKNYGSIDVGKKADIIVLNESPIDNINTLSEVISVFKLGKKVK